MSGTNYGPLQLSYTVTPASVPAGAGAVVLEIAVTNDTGADLGCREIQIAFPAAQLGASITATTDSGAPWAVAVDSGNANAFDITPQPPATGLPTGQSFGVQFAIPQPSATPGPATIEILEATDAGLGQGTLTVELVAASQLSITEFTASGLFVSPGAPVTFTWATLEADSVTLDWGEGSHDGGASGTWTVEPVATITAVLTAVKGGTGSVSAQLTITVETPQILSLANDPDPPTVGQGGPLTLSWETLFAQRCTLSFSATGGEVEVPTTTTGYAVHPQVSGTYELRAIGEGRAIPSSLDVQVEPVQATLTAPVAVPPDTPAPVAWTTQYASAVTLSPDPGIGTLPLSGAVDYPLYAPTDIQLTAAGLDPVELSASVGIIPLLTGLTVSAWATEAGDSGVVLEWACRDALLGTLDGATVDPAGGTQNVGGLPSAQEHKLVLDSGYSSAVVAVTVFAAPGSWTEGLVLSFAGGDGGGLGLDVPGGQSQVAWGTTGGALPAGEWPAPECAVTVKSGQDQWPQQGQSGTLGFTVTSRPETQLWACELSDQAGALLRLFVTCTIRL